MCEACVAAVIHNSSDMRYDPQKNPWNPANDEAILPKYPKKKKVWPIQPLRDTIKCPGCGYDTGLNPNGFLMVIPPGGLVCHCGCIIIHSNAPTL